MTKVRQCGLEAKHLTLHLVWITNYVAAFDTRLLVLFLMLIFVAEWRSLCRRTCVEISHSSAICHKNEKHKWKVPFHYSDFPCAFSMYFHTDTKTHIIHWFDAQSTCQMSSKIYHGYMSFQVRCCAVAAYFHPLITRLRHPNSGFFITVSLW